MNLLVGDHSLRIGDRFTPGRQTLTVLDIRTCLWCEQRFYVTTRTPTRDRATRRFCGRACANRGGGFTHDDAWKQKIQRAGALAARRRSHERALAMLNGAKTPAQLAAAVLKIRKRAYHAGWSAGRKNGARNERTRLLREAKRRRIAAERGVAA